MLDGGCAVGRREKHVEIEDAIMQLGRIDERIRLLIEKINGDGKISQPGNKVTEPPPLRHPLGEFLAMTANRLVEMREKTLALLDELESLLF